MSVKCRGIIVSVLPMLMLSSAYAEGYPREGTIRCHTQARNAMPIKGKPSDGLVTANTTHCTIDNSDVRFTQIMTIRVDPVAGKSELVGGYGYSVNRAGKTVQVFQLESGNWDLKFDKGKIVGWSAKGTTKAIAGFRLGETMRWEAKPTGPHSSVVTYRYD